MDKYVDSENPQYKTLSENKLIRQVLEANNVQPTSSDDQSAWSLLWSCNGITGTRQAIYEGLGEH